MALLLLPAVRWSKNERDTEGVAHSVIARADRCVAPASRPPEPGVLLCGVVKLGWLGCGRGGPQEARQLAGDRDDRDVVRLSACPHRGVEVMQPLPRTVTDLQDVVGLAFLAVGECGADAGFAAVMPGGLDQQATGECRSGLRDRPVPV
jgi:hypothetical protein